MKVIRTILIQNDTKNLPKLGRTAQICHFGKGGKCNAGVSSGYCFSLQEGGINLWAGTVVPQWSGSQELHQCISPAAKSQSCSMPRDQWKSGKQTALIISWGWEECITDMAALRSCLFPCRCRQLFRQLPRRKRWWGISGECRRTSGQETEWPAALPFCKNICLFV